MSLCPCPCSSLPGSGGCSCPLASPGRTPPGAEPAVPMALLTDKASCWMRPPVMVLSGSCTHPTGAPHQCRWGAPCSSRGPLAPGLARTPAWRQWGPLVPSGRRGAGGVPGCICQHAGATGLPAAEGTEALESVGPHFKALTDVLVCIFSVAFKLFP